MAEAVKKTEAATDVRDVTPIRKTATTASPLRLVDPFTEIERIFEGFFPRGRSRPSRWDLLNWPGTAELAAKSPRVDVIERDAEVLVRAELPGVEKDKLDISLTDDTVTIKATTGHEEKEEKGDYYRCEISRGEFVRTLTLPAAVNTDKAKASFKNGILELTLPKMEQAKRRNIKVE
ncbi:MAG: Hsp20/alpha crystallin family protein [Gammaproteobacteria bacterium]|nr:Hsp20/alpha crystallin family protein [Gammaproteobacteria bacterium]